MFVVRDTEKDNNKKRMRWSGTDAERVRENNVFNAAVGRNAIDEILRTGRRKWYELGKLIDIVQKYKS